MRPCTHRELRTGLSGTERRTMDTVTIDKVSKIIEGLCEKLGTTAQYLIPELAKMKTAELAVWFVLSFAGMAAGIYFIPKAWAYDHREDKGWSEDSFWVIAPLFVTIVFGIWFLMSAADLAGWIASPTAKSVMTIIKTLKS